MNTPREPLLALRNIYFAYESSRTVLCGCSGEVYPGERVGLTGAIGSGKTTLLWIMVGLIKPQHGKVIAFGQERRTEADFREVRRRVGLLFQNADDQLFCPTVIEDVAFGPLNLGKSRVEALAVARTALEKLGLAGYEDRVPYHLSGGEKRLVALAGTLAMNPDVLLLDEPTAELDEEAYRRVIAVLENLPQAMIVVSHDRQLLSKLTHRQLTLVEGQLIPSPQPSQGALPVADASDTGG